MKKEKINGFDITIFSKENVARMIERIYANDSLRNYIYSFNDYVIAKRVSSQIAEFIVQYAFLTGDFSDKIINEIVGQYKKEYCSHIRFMQEGWKNNRQFKKMSKHILFEKVVVPSLNNYWMERLGISRPLSLVDSNKILRAIATSANNNHFYTHSFNSAILPSVEENGLDISCELYRRELKEFEPFGHQVFSTGKLYEIEFSDSSFSYADIVPERIRNTYQAAQVERKENESLSDYLCRCIEYKVNNSGYNIDEKTKNRIIEDNKKVARFYYGHNKNSIAIIKKNDSVFYTDYNFSKNLINSMTVYLTSEYTYDVPAEMRLGYQEKQELVKMFNGEYKNFDEGSLKRIDDKLEEISRLSEKGKTLARNMKTFAYGYVLGMDCMFHFTTSNGDGYPISDGRLDRKQFAIATYISPVKERFSNSSVFE